MRSTSYLVASSSRAPKVTAFRDFRCHGRQWAMTTLSFGQRAFVLFFSKNEHGSFAVQNHCGCNAEKSIRTKLPVVRGRLHVQKLESV